MQSIIIHSLVVPHANCTNHNYYIKDKEMG